MKNSMLVLLAFFMFFSTPIMAEDFDLAKDNFTLYTVGEEMDPSDDDMTIIATLDRNVGNILKQVSTVRYLECYLQILNIIPMICHI